MSSRCRNFVLDEFDQSVSYEYSSYCEIRILSRLEIFDPSSGDGIRRVEQHFHDVFFYLERFLNGEDSNIDYTSIDNNENLDDVKIRERDEEEKYFDGEDPYTHNHE